MYLGNIDLKIPNNHFLKWLNDKRNENKILLNFSAGREKYLTNFVTEEEICKWESNEPVFISAQTGTGKNYFVQHVLIKNLIKDNLHNHTNQKILLLSNRVALNRQSKADIADLLLDYTGQNVSQEMEIYYKPEGIDAFLKQFGNIYIYSYKQFFETNFLNQDFKYVVCDECHYFTSDGTFEPYTEQILRKIIKEGQDSIRIYMSATLEVVFEPIIREEYNLIEYNENQLREDGNKLIEELSSDPQIQQKIKAQEMNCLIAGVNLITANLSGNINRCYVNSAKLNEEKEKYQTLDFKRDIERDVNQFIKELYPLNIRFYYMERNYDYVQKVFFYENEEELINKIKSDLEESNTKWLIFVRDKKTGKKLLEGINDTNTCTFISAESRKRSGNEQDEFNHIVQNGSFNSQVLISTSTLDNGINIKDDSVKNIVIDLFDRTEFIQMLGRIRVSDNNTINLFIRRYSTNDIEKMLNHCVTKLFSLLRIDTISKENRMSWFDKQRLEDDNTFNPKDFMYSNDTYSYNSNAIYHLIDEARYFMKFLKHFDDNYHLSVPDSSKSLRSLRSKIYNYYQHNPEGKNKCWSRIIIDLLETNEEAQEREKEIRNDCKKGIANRYQYVFDETFPNFLYDRLLPEHYQSLIDNGINEFVKLIPDYDSKVNVWHTKKDNTVQVNTNGKTPFELVVAAKSNGKEISSFEKLKILKEDFKFEIDISNYQKYDSKINYYKNLAYYGAFENSMDMQMYWLEKLGYKPERIQLSNNPEVEVAEIENMKNKFFEKYLKNRIVSQEELEKNKHKKKDGTFSNYYNEDYLKKHGIKKDSEEAKKFTALYNVRLNKGQKVLINETSYEIQSYSDGTEKHSTYYILHSVP